MISSIANNVVNGYIQEACAILDYDIAYVRVIYVPTIEPIAGIPQHVAITADGCLIIDETWVNREISNKTPTRVRCEVYCKVRMLYQQTKNQGVFNQYNNEAIDIERTNTSYASTSANGGIIVEAYSKTSERRIGDKHGVSLDAKRISEG